MWKQFVWRFCRFKLFEDNFSKEMVNEDNQIEMKKTTKDYKSWRRLNYLCNFSWFGKYFQFWICSKARLFVSNFFNWMYVLCLKLKWKSYKGLLKLRKIKFIFVISHVLLSIFNFEFGKMQDYLYLISSINFIYYVSNFKLIQIIL